MKKHFVQFFSPGTLVAETTIKPINSWNVNEAIRLADKIIERYNASPYAFQFFTKERKEDELDSKITKRSNLYYLGGKVLTLKQIKAKNDPNNKILIENMEINNYDKVIINTNSWKWTQPLDKNDIVLDYKKPNKLKA